MDAPLVKVIGTTGKEGKGESHFAQPRGICMDYKTREVFIVDCNNHRIQVFHLTSLAYIRQIGKGVQGNSPGSLNYAVGICLDTANNLFVADTNNHRVAVFNKITGGYVKSIGSHGNAPGLLSSPYGVCVDHTTGWLYVADYDNHRVQAFDKETGNVIKIIGDGGGSEPGQMNQPIVVCIDYEMNYLLVADYSNNRVQVFDKTTGAFVKHFGCAQGPNSLHGPRGMCICQEANLLFVADRENHRVQMFDKSTHVFIRHIGGIGAGTAPGTFHRPMEMCVDIQEGVLLVVDGYNHRVQVIEVPELQAEKLKLQAAARSEAQAGLIRRNQLRPSLLAVSTSVESSTSLISLN